MAIFSNNLTFKDRQQNLSKSCRRIHGHLLGIILNLIGRTTTMCSFNLPSQILRKAWSSGVPQLSNMHLSGLRLRMFRGIMLMTCTRQSTQYKLAMHRGNAINSHMMGPNRLCHRDGWRRPMSLTHGMCCLFLNTSWTLLTLMARRTMLHIRSSIPKAIEFIQISCLGIGLFDKRYVSFCSVDLYR